MNNESLEFNLRKEALDAALSLNRSYIGNKREWQITDLFSASDIVDDAEIFLNFLRGEL